jgi:mannan endo-1,4-beta-mannosidase
MGDLAMKRLISVLAFAVLLRVADASSKYKSTHSPSTIQLGAFNADIGTIKVTFVGWKKSPPCFSGKTTFIYWENPTISYDSIISGSQDPVLRKFALEVCPNTIVALFHEMNLNESPWFGSAAKEVLAWRHIHDIIGNKVKYAWVVNDTSIPNVKGNQPMDYYPGDDYIDIVGVDGFNWGSSSFSQVIEPAFSQVKGINKPHWITSFGTDSANQAAWITDAIAQAKEKGISGLIYFSYSDQGGKDFTLTAEGKAAFHL